MLHIIATPIGNLKDISKRAIEVLTSCDAVICENYSGAKKLFNLLEIDSNKPFFVFADINSKYQLPKALEFIKQYTNVALISEAGTPLINDPGFELIRELRDKNEFEIVSVPGASALTSMLSISGLPTDKFMFMGFLPKTSGKRINTLKTFKEINEICKTTFVLFESKYKIVQLLEELSTIYPSCFVSVGCELTKMHEKVYYGEIRKVLDDIKKSSVKGEFVVHIKIV